MKGYILAGCYYTATKVYTNKEAADKACEEYNMGEKMGGGRDFVHVVEVEIVTE